MKKFLKNIFAVCMLMMILQLAPITANAAVTSIAEGTYTIKNLGTGKYLNVYANKDANAANIDIYQKDKTVGQDFKIYKYGNSYALTPCSSSKGRVVNVYTEKTAKSGHNVCLWDRTNHSTQLWKFDKVSGGYIIRCENNTKLVLNATGSKNSSNVNIVKYNSKSKNQIWVLEAPETVKNNTSPGGNKTNVTPVVNTASQLKITEAKYPDSIYQGEAFSCKGKITSNYKLTNVTGKILKSDGKTACYSKSVNPNNTSYNLYNSAIDKAMLFNKLSQGTYYYSVIATDKSGRTLTLINAKFTVVKSEEKILKINKEKISKVGWQKNYTSYCQAYSLAYCRTILDGKKHTYKQYWGKGGGQPNKAKYKHLYFKTEKQALKIVYEQINKGKPCIIFGKQNGGGQHYVTVYGYTGVKNPNKMTLNNLVIIDSIKRKGGHYLKGKNVKNSIKSLKKYGNGKYAVLVAQ